MKRNKPELITTAVEPSRRAMSTKFRMENGEDGQRRMTGHGSVFNTPSQDLGGFREIIHPGAFDKALEMADVRCLFNHNPDIILGRYITGRSNNTMSLSPDANGLAYDCDLPDTTDAANLSVSMERGDVTQSSFAFLMDWSNEGAKENGGSYEWEMRADGSWFLHIYEVAELLDVSPVTYPAYLEADAQNARSAFRRMFEKRQQAEREAIEQAKSEQLELMKAQAAKSDQDYIQTMLSIKDEHFK